MSRDLLTETQAQIWAMEPNALGAFMADMGAMQELAIGAMVPTDPEQGQKRALHIRDGVAHIAIGGPMLKTVSPLMRMLGYKATSTQDVGDDIDTALADESVKTIMLDVDSPGGIVSGVSELADKISAAKAVKPVHAHASDVMASAAYWVGSQASSVSANPSSRVGSIGVYSVMPDSSAAATKQGVKINVIASHPLKGAGVSGAPVTDEQLADSKRLVMDYAAMFRNAVSSGRNMVDVEPVATGQEWLARDAVSLGLIDRVSSESEAHQLAVIAGSATRTSTDYAASVVVSIMDPSQTPDTAEAVVAKAQTESPQSGAQEIEMPDKIESGAGTPVANEREIQDLRIKAAKSEILEDQMKSIKSKQREELVGKYSDRFTPAMSKGAMKLVEAYGDDMAGAEEWLKSLQPVTRKDPESAPSVELRHGVVTTSIADSKLMALVGTDNPNRLRFLESLSDNVDHVLGDGRAVLKDGRVMTMDALKKMVGFVVVVAVCLFGVDANAGALSAARATTCKGSGVTSQYLMTASSTIYAGSMVMIDSAGTAVAAAAAASNHNVVGVAQKTMTSASSGSYWIPVTDRVICRFAGDTLEQDDVGKLVYADDDQTVDETVASNDPVAGVLVEYVSASVGWVFISSEINMGRTNAITSPLTLTADLTLANAEYIDNDTNGKIKLVAVGGQAEDLGIDLATTANTVTFDTGTSVATWDFGATGGTLIMSNDQNLEFGTDAEISLYEAGERLTFGFTSNLVSITTNTGANMNLGTIGQMSTIRDVTGVDSLTLADCGKTIAVTAAADGDQITLPEASTAPGCVYTIVYTGADAGALIDISPLDSDADGIEGGCYETTTDTVVYFSGTADADIGLTKVSGLTGDWIQIRQVGSAMWAVTGCQGIWANN